MRMLMRVLMRVLVLVGVLVVARVGQVDVKFDAFDLTTLGAMSMEMVALQRKFGQLLLQTVKINAQIQHGAQKHVAADPAENIEIKCFQLVELRADDASSLIWLAA
jgi:hypothetical protein